MPNYCYNRLFAKKEFIDKYLDNDGDFNFNKLIPMPESYRDVECSTDTYASVYRYVVKVKKDLDLWNRIAEDPFLLDKKGSLYANGDSTLNRYDEEMAKKAVSNYNKYGSLTWYEWANKHWGVKWNASNTKVIAINGDNECIQFITAWRPPYGVIKALRAINPELKWFYRTEDGEEWTEA